jgi:hypothetical protein
MVDLLSPADLELEQLRKIEEIPYTELPDETVAALRDTFGTEGLGRYRPEYAEQARRMCSITGATDAQLALWFDVSENTILNWRSRFPAFRDACKMGKEVADQRVEDAYYQRAVGYDKVTKKVQVNKDGSVTEFEEITHYPADGKVAFNWLKNRRQTEWRDRREIVDPTKKDDDNMPKRSKIEIARQVVYFLNRSADEAGKLPAAGAVQSITHKVTIDEE